MADITGICNQALAAVGTRSSISSINEASNEARTCLIHYDPTRRQLLRAAHWGFSRAYSPLSVLKARFGTPERQVEIPKGYVWTTTGPEPPPPWLYAYALPPGYLAMRYIIPASATEISTTPPIFGTQSPTLYPDSWMGPMVKFEISNIWLEGSLSAAIVSILTNMPKAIACYTVDISEPSQFEESFTQALIQALAANICQTLTGDLKLLDALVKLANSMILDARVKNANEGLTALDVMPDWFRVRGLGPAVGTGPWVAEYGPLFGGVL